MKKSYFSPEIDVTKLHFDRMMSGENFYSDPGNGQYQGDDNNKPGDPFDD